MDPRLTPARPDLAAASFKNKVAADRFVDGVRRQIMRPMVPLRRRPEPSLGFDTEAIFGEHVTVFDENEGWAWVQLERDGYVGYMSADALGEPREPTHRVKALGTFIYPVADIKAPPLLHLSINSQLTIVEHNDKFSRLDRGGFVITRHITERARFERDPVDVAERLIGTPYLWGGRTRIGIDCSGLVQISLEAAGVACPRDSDMQAAALGEPVPFDSSLEGLERGDLIFWRGHVGIMSDGIMLVHANAHHMAVVVETLPEAVERIARTGSTISTIRRLMRDKPKT